MHQLVDPKFYINTEVNIQKCYSDEDLSQEFDYRFTQSNEMNHSKDFYLSTKTYREHKAEPERVFERIEDNDYPKPIIFDGLYKSFTEANLEELDRIYDDLMERKPIDNMDL